MRQIPAWLLAAALSFACLASAQRTNAPEPKPPSGPLPKSVPSSTVKQAPATRGGPPQAGRVVPKGAPRTPVAMPRATLSKVTEVEGITEYRLSNGLKILLFPDPSKPTITVNITYLVGSRHENYGETGMAHLLEHLLFKGTPRHPAIDQEFNQRGVRYNGTTWLDRTNYFELFQASDDNLAWAIELEADRMVNSFIAKKDLDSEMTVVRNEYESGENSPFGVLLKRLQSITFDWHSYGRSTIGNRSDIENVRIENLQAFYRTYYQPDNATLLIAGKFDPDKALKLIVEHFGKIPKPVRTLPPEWTVEPTQDGPREFSVRRKGDIQIVAVSYKVPSSLHPQSDALGFSSMILSQSPTGRLHKALVETGKAAQAFGFPLTGSHPGMQIFGAVVKRGDPIEPVREELIKLVESFGNAPPTKEEMERTRLSMLNQVEKTLANHESLGVQMSEYIALGDWRLFFLARDELEKITAEQVAAASKAFFRRDNRTVGFFLPEDEPQRAEIPPAPTVAELMKDFKPKAGAALGEAFDPSHDNIDKRTRLVQIDDIKAALLPKKTRGELVHITLVLRIGNEKDLFNQRIPSAMAASMLTRGTTRFTRAQLSDEWDRLKVSGGVGGSTANLQTTRANLEGTLRLLAHVLKEPSFPESEFEQLRNQRVTGLMSQLAEPEARASDELARHFNIYPKGDPRYSPSLEESLEELKAAKLEDARRFYQQFYGASPAHIAIVGDFDDKQAEALIRELFANWKPKVPYGEVLGHHKDIAPIDKVVTTPDKENAVIIARVNVEMRDDDPDFPALYLANYILGGGAGFDSRFGARIRQKEGLSYGVGSSLSVGALDRAGHWSAYAIASPTNIAKVEAALREELARALKEGFTEAEVASAKSGVMQMRTQNRAQDSTLAPAWVSLMHLGRTFQFSKQFEAKLLALKPADLQAALRKYVEPSKLTVVKAGDFMKK